MMLRIRLDRESERRAAVLRAYLHRGPEAHPGYVRDALLTGLLSRTTGDEVRLEAGRPDVTLEGAEVEVDLTPKYPGDQRGAEVAARTAELVTVLGVPEQRVHRAAVTVGFRRLDPERDFPVAQFPGFYDPPVGSGVAR